MTNENGRKPRTELTATSKPEWVLPEHWERLQKYRDKDRKADPTDGFLHTMAKQHPDYNELEFRALSDAKRSTYLLGLVGIPRKPKSPAEKKTKADR